MNAPRPVAATRQTCQCCTDSLKASSQEAWVLSAGAEVGIREFKGITAVDVSPGERARRRGRDVRRGDDPRDRVQRRVTQHVHVVGKAHRDTCRPAVQGCLGGTTDDAATDARAGRHSGPRGAAVRECRLPGGAGEVLRIGVPSPRGLPGGQRPPGVVSDRSPAWLPFHRSERSSLSVESRSAALAAPVAGAGPAHGWRTPSPIPAWVGGCSVARAG